MPYRSSAAALAACLAAITLSGCVIAPPRQQVVYAPQPGQPAPYYVDTAPPAPVAEVVTVAPPGYFWISGIWLWEGGRHVWHPGHLEAHRAGYRWTPHQWVPSGHGWQLRGGFWAQGR
ncbi:MAG: hypothetical protein JWP29_3240 [Rhodoferax sp.]|nr:hypothetical protein [Rhodoferax sp.]